MATVMVIGGSRGIGLELVKQYATTGWRVHATTRTTAEPGALARIQGDVVISELDVRNRDQIDALAGAVAEEGVDVLIHNAGVYGTGMSKSEVMRVNAEAPIEVTQALLGAVERGEQRKIVLMTSQMGARRGSKQSLGIYGDSKAALNDRFRELAPEWGRRGLIAVVMHPGWVRTDMGGRHASLSVEESASGIRRVVAGLDSSYHGRFWCWDGREHPW